MVSVTSSSPAGTARVIAADIKLHHSVFAMPFAVLAAFLAAAPSGQAVDWSRFGGQLLLVVLAMVLARTVAMLANRLLDREIDGENPRTAGRALPSGRLAVSSAARALALGAAGFVFVCGLFGVFYGNWWPVLLALPVLGWLSVYPFFKRFTSVSHLYLGSSLALSPLAAAVAVDPPALLHQPVLWLIAAMVLFWVAGFDVIYALQDVEVDRRLGHFSLPSRFGVGPALWASRGLHAASGLLLVVAVWLDPRLGVLFAIGVGLVIAILAYEHLTVARWGTTRIALAFFTLNGVVSCILGLLGVADVLVAAS